MAVLCDAVTTVSCYLTYKCGSRGEECIVVLEPGMNLLVYCSDNTVNGIVTVNCQKIATHLQTDDSGIFQRGPTRDDFSYPLFDYSEPPYCVLYTSSVPPLQLWTRIALGEGFVSSNLDFYGVFPLVSRGVKYRFLKQKLESIIVTYSPDGQKHRCTY